MLMKTTPTAPASLAQLHQLLDAGQAWSATYRGRLSSHLPMAQQALLELGASAARLQAWYDGGRCGPRPPGRLRPYASPAVSGVDQLVGGVVARFAGDPDARPLPLQWFGRF